MGGQFSVPVYMLDTKYLYNGRLVLTSNHTGVPVTIGSTPLHLSPDNNFSKLLLNAGANSELTDVHGTLPEDYKLSGSLE